MQVYPSIREASKRARIITYFSFRGTALTIWRAKLTRRTHLPTSLGRDTMQLLFRNTLANEAPGKGSGAFYQTQRTLQAG